MDFNEAIRILAAFEREKRMGGVARRRSAHTRGNPADAIQDEEGDRPAPGPRRRPGNPRAFRLVGGVLMGVRKFRSVDSMPGVPPRRPLDPENLRLAFEVSDTALSGPFANFGYAFYAASGRADSLLNHACNFSRVNFQAKG